MSTYYSHHYSMDYSKQWPPKSQSTNNVQIPGQQLLPLYPPPLSRNQSSSFLFPYVFTKCLFSVSQSASVLNTFFRQILPITLPVRFIIFKTRFRAVMQPLRPCGGAKIQRQVFLAPQSYSFHYIRQVPAAIPHLLTQQEMLPISNTAQNPHQGFLCPEIKRTAFFEGQRRCSNRVPTLSAYLCIKGTLNINKSTNRTRGAFQKSLFLEEFQATQGTLQLPE